MDISTTLKEALAAIRIIEAELSPSGEKHIAQQMRRELSRYYSTMKVLSDENITRNNSQKDLFKATKEYEDYCDLVLKYKKDLDTKQTR